MLSSFGDLTQVVVAASVVVPLSVGDGQGQDAICSTGVDSHAFACLELEGAGLHYVARAVLDIVGVSRRHIAAAVGDDEGRLGGVVCADADRGQLGLI